jgi:hypothetical protein
MKTPEHYENGRIIQPEIPTAIETGTKPPTVIDAKLVSPLPTLDNHNHLDPIPQSVLVIITNPGNLHYNPLLRSISLLAEHNTNNPNSSSLSIQPIESSTNMRNEEHEPSYQFRKRKRNNPDDEEDE